MATITAIPAWLIEWGNQFWVVATDPQFTEKASETDAQAFRLLKEKEAAGETSPPGHVGSAESYLSFLEQAKRAGLTLTVQAGVFITGMSQGYPQTLMMYAHGLAHLQRAMGKIDVPLTLDDIATAFSQGFPRMDSLALLWLAQKEEVKPHGKNRLDLVELS